MKNLHTVLTPGGAGIQAMQEDYDKRLQLLMVVSGLGTTDCVRKHGEPLLVRGMARKAEMNVRTAPWRLAGQDFAATTNGERAACLPGRIGRAGGGVSGREDAAGAGVSRSGERTDCRHSLVDGTRLCLRVISADWLSRSARPLRGSLRRQSLQMLCEAERARWQVGRAMLQRALVVVQAGLSLVCWLEPDCLRKA